MSLHLNARKIVDSIISRSLSKDLLEDFSRDFVRSSNLNKNIFGLLKSFSDSFNKDDFKSFDTQNTRRISEEAIQSIGKIVDHLDEIKKHVDFCTQKVGISENIAAYAKPLGVLVGQIKDALEHGGDLVEPEKFLQQTKNHWYDIVLSGEMIKNASGVKNG